jgi:hypothetical protein
MCSIKVSLPDRGQSVQENPELGAISIPVIDNATNAHNQSLVASIPPAHGIELKLPLDQIDRKCNMRNDGVHANRIHYSVCVDRDNSPCAVAFTEPQKFLSYQFNVPTGPNGLFARRETNPLGTAQCYLQWHCHSETKEM